MQPRTLISGMPRPRHTSNRPWCVLAEALRMSSKRQSPRPRKAKIWPKQCDVNLSRTEHGQR
eukprot:1093059-Prymnesium_polylepis.1